MTDAVTIVGGGLAGSEAAWQLAHRDIPVRLYEMRPRLMTPAHTGDSLAELVCSNSLGSNLTHRASGLLKAELRRLGSLLIAVADRQRVPAGSALAVDREGFAAEVTHSIATHPHITLIREEVADIPAGPTIIASGPLTPERLAQSIRAFTGSAALSFYDAIAPIVTVDSIDFTIAFRASRYHNGASAEGDYINCPLNEDEYHRLVAALVDAESIPLRDFEHNDPQFFEACLPIEVLAARGEQALAYGPLRPVGLRDPHTGRFPFAVVQLRQDNAAATLYNLVGFQTHLKYGEQDRVLRLIPGLANARFVRYGSMHRNTYLNAPSLLQPTLQSRSRADLFFAGQIAGLEGYAANIAGGWLAGVNMARLMAGRPLLVPPPETMIGALMHYITRADPMTFQPMKANFGLLPALDTTVHGKRARGVEFSTRALAQLARWMAANNL
ncbi:MAG TPA: methylenetetrahydrofolate--tRNA-(uracil(54)-C(5))-methyltransferase (FADH(2)-oxidizing) TrmFO [Anaerolineae bacterium]|nr:methylenetetrahydrofolate--tRNA-(uracil(54)-C(5))-methyltransferase (FADH(2)-oxidizing) TrmFO [Anaerolineae bacterium]HQH38341.1 methylenetetrahydrofolate--tRNA-(uracil(54)-C(5))-methyltransferase (FADH(2)-oxidizing) TrmFO [Anaerolineae bacterium]